MNTISIVFGSSRIIKGSIKEFKDDGGKAWRIRIIAKDNYGVLPIKFAREKDAQAGLNGILKHIDLYNITAYEFRDKVIKMTPKEFLRIICEEMAW